MADKEEKKVAPIIIKKVVRGHGGHHGGAWKVAYADFVTAMMAFFLLLWLLNATTEEQKLGIADYFSPSSVSRSKSGSGGIMGGRTFTKEGAMPNDTTPVGVMIEIPTDPPDWDNTGDPVESTASEETGPGGIAEGAKEPDEESVLEAFLTQREEEQFAAAEQALRQAIDNIPELRNLANNLIIDETDEGLRIQLVDEAGESMFASGSADMFGHTKKLLALVVDVIKQMPQQVSISGHTDSVPYQDSNGYSNWELSSDRANSARRGLIEAGLPAGRIAAVAGRADQEHLEEENPNSPRNRRISFILLRHGPQADAPAASSPRIQSGALPGQNPDTAQ
ncbi:MAG: flagellar motor protein MotB [Alphaproteobacteria bacterium]